MRSRKIYFFFYLGKQVGIKEDESKGTVPSEHHEKLEKGRQLNGPFLTDKNGDKAKAMSPKYRMSPK